MARDGGGGGGVKMLRLWKFLDTQKGSSEKIVGLGEGVGRVTKLCILQNQQEGEGGFLKIELLARGAAKISSFKF